MGVLNLYYRAMLMVEWPVKAAAFRGNKAIKDVEDFWL